MDKIEYIDTEKIDGNIYYIAKTINLNQVESDPKIFKLSNYDIEIEKIYDDEYYEIKFKNIALGYNFNTNNIQYAINNPFTDTNKVHYFTVEYEYANYKLDVGYLAIPVPEYLPNVKLITDRIFITCIKNIQLTNQYKYPTELGLNSNINCSKTSIQRLKDELSNKINQKKLNIDLQELDLLLNNYNAFYKVVPQYKFLNKFILFDKLAFGYSIDMKKSGGLLQEIKHNNIQNLNSINIENSTYSFEFEFARITSADINSKYDGNMFELDDVTDYLLKITNIKFVSKTDQKTLFVSNKSYVSSYSLIQSLVNIINDSPFGTISVDDFFKSESSNYTFADCEQNVMLDIFMMFSNKHKIKQFVESYIRKQTCMTKLYDLNIQSILRFHSVTRYLFLIMIGSKYFKLILNINRRDLYKHIPKYIEEKLDSTQIHFKGFNLDTRELQYDNAFKLDNSYKIIFDTGNNAHTTISTRMLEALNYIPKTTLVPDFNIERPYTDRSNWPEPYNLIPRNNTIINGFVLSDVGVNDNIPVIFKTQIVKLKFKFISSRLDMSPNANSEVEYDMHAYVKKSSGYDLLIGHNTLKKLFDNGYAIKYKVPKGTFRADDLTIYEQFLKKNPIDVVSKEELKLAIDILGSISLLDISPILITSDNINSIKNSAKRYFNTFLAEQKIQYFRELFSDILDASNAALLSQMINLFYDKLNIPDTERVYV